MTTSRSRSMPRTIVGSDVVGRAHLDLRRRTSSSPPASSPLSASSPGVSVSGGYAQPTTIPCGFSSRSQRLGQTADRELRGHVRRVAVHADDPRGRRHEHEVPAAALDHRRHHRPDRVERPEVVQLPSAARRRSVESSSKWPGCAPPALVTSTSTGPNCAMSRPSASSKDSRSVTSAGSAQTRVGSPGARLELVLGLREALAVAGDERDAGTARRARGARSPARCRSSPR